MPKKISLLLVEDNEDDYVLTKELLDLKIVSLDWAQSLEAAISRASMEKFDIVLLDLGMPDSQGLGTFDRMRNELYQSPVIIVLTGNDDDELAREALKNGAQDYLVKGTVNTEILMRSIRYSLERHNADRQLRESNEQLLFLNEQLRAARDEAFQASRIKSEFVANISHELRTPLSGVLGLLGILELAELDEEQLSMVSTARESAEQLLHLVNDLLDFSKLESGHMRTKDSQFQLSSVLDEIMQTMGSAASKKNILLSADIESNIPPLYGDAKKVKQVLLSLVSNAVKFTNEGGARIKVRKGDEIAGKLTITFTISDTGIGIDPCDRPRLFDPFTQVDGSTTRRYGGSGLGLALTKRLVEIMGGRIGFASEKGKGSTFWFSLPFPIQNEAIEVRTINDFEFCPIINDRVLVLEDNNVLQMLLSGQLQSIGFTPDFVTSANEALAALGKNAYGVILIDTQALRQSEALTIQQLRKLEEKTEIRTPIIGLLSSNLDSEKERCISAGFDDILSKPVSADSLSSTLRKWMDLPNNSNQLRI